MESKLAKHAEEQLIAAAKRMTREQRLRAFIEHSKKMIQLQRAGKALRDGQSTGTNTTAKQMRT